MSVAAGGLQASRATESRGAAVGGATLASAHTETVALQVPAPRKVAKTTVARRPVARAEAASSVLDFDEATSDDASAEPARAAQEADTGLPELDEDFARELGFTEDAERKPVTPRAPERTVYIPPAPDTKERLSPDDVKAVVLANQPAITACLREHAQGTPVEKGGRFLVRWSVLPSGATSGVVMDTDTLKATPLAGCIEGVVRRWKFPVHRVRLDEPIRFPFVF